MSDHIGDDDELFDDDASVDAARPQVDVLAPAASTVVRRDPRERLRSSRLGQLIVLAVTAAIVLAGVQIVRMQQASDVASQTGGATVVKLPGNSRVPPPEVGKPAQGFSITTHDGRQVTLDGLKGKAVWVTFGASWCSSCQAEIPDIEATHRAYAARGVVVVGINIQEGNDAVKAYAERIGLTFPIGADPTSVIADEYAVGAIPAHYFIDADGVVRDIRVGGLAPNTMTSILDKLVDR